LDRAEPTERHRWADMAESLAGLGYWRMDVATRTLRWSPNMFRIFGFEPDLEPALDAAMSRVHPDDRADADLRLDASVSGVPTPSETRIVWPDGTVRHIEGRGASEYGPDGEIVAIFGIVMDVTERREAHAVLATQAAHLGLLADHGTDLIIEVDQAQTILYASPSIRRYGYAPEAVIGRQAAELIHPDDLGKLAAIAADLLTSGAVDPHRDRSYRLLRADGTPSWIEGNPTVIRDEAGQPAGVITLLRDIDERRKAELALAAREAQLRVVSEHTRDVVFQYGLDHRILYASPAVRRYGYEPDALVGQVAQDLVHPDDRAKVAAMVGELFTGGPVDPERDRTHRVRAASGDYVWMEGQPTIVRDPQGKPISVVSLLRDISERRAADEALAESERRYRLLTDNATDMIACYDAKAVFTFIAPAVIGVMGYTPEEMVGSRTTSFMHPDDVRPVLHAFQTFFAAGPGAEPIRFEYRAFRKDGSMIWLEAHPKAIYDPDGTFVEFQDVVRDITHRHHLEEELRAARDAAESAAAVKSDFMANMSHEIRTPLTAVIGFSSLISARTDLDPTARGHADRIAGAGRALLALVNDVLDFSKLEAGRVEISPKPVNPAAIAREALDLFSLQAESKGLALVFDPDPALPDCIALDPQAVGQVLLNLLGNAVKFSQGGRVALSLAYEPDAQVLKVRVRDTGPGLSPKQAERLFQRFSQVDASSTRRHGGTGLGLAICKGLVEAMGGQIGVDSVLGQGSTFHFAIPAPRAAALSPAVDGAEDLGVLDGLRLLVVDDNPINRELVRAILSPLGVEVTEAVDGPTGLDAAAGLPFDVILLDIRMPGLDGPQVLARLRAEPGPNQNAPILAFSAEVDADAAAGFDAFVAKPLDPAALIHAIAHWTTFETAEEDLDALAS
jgi:PAS domain S-box-containing protein